MSNKVFSFYSTVLSDPVKRREYDSKGMLYVYDYNIIVSVSPLSLAWKMFVFILLLFIHIVIYHLLAAGVSQPSQRPYIDMQRSWDKAFNMVSGYAEITFSTSGTNLPTSCNTLLLSILPLLGLWEVCWLCISPFLFFFLSIWLSGRSSMPSLACIVYLRLDIIKQCC